MAQNARIDVAMQVGNIHEEVTVHGEGLAQVNTESSELGGTITGKELLQLQLNGRNFTQLITLVPGVSNQTGQDEGVVGAEGQVNYSVNGGRTEYNNWEVDGGDMMDNGSNFSLNVYPSVEAIEEVQVLTSNYGAQYGKQWFGHRRGGNQIGTNAFHGSLWEFARNEAFNAHNYFDVPGNAESRLQEARLSATASAGLSGKTTPSFSGCRTGGERTFPTTFTASCPQWRIAKAISTMICNVPNPTDCPVDPNTGNPFPNNQLPSLDPNGQILLTLIPAPTPGSPARIPSSPRPWANPRTGAKIWFASITISILDCASRSADPRFLGHDQGHRNLGKSTSFPTIGTHFVGPGVEMVARRAATVSPTLLNEFVASYTTDHIRQDNNTNPSVWTRAAAFTMPGLFPDFGGKLPDICLSTSGAYGGGFCEGPTAFPGRTPIPTFTYRDNVTKSLGKHKLVIRRLLHECGKERDGIYRSWRRLEIRQHVAGLHWECLRRLLMGNIANFSSRPSSQPKYHINFKIFEPYFQDDYHIRQKPHT